jgi:uncharacterized protein
MARRVVFTVVTWICLTCAGVAQTLTFPALTGRVVDEAGLLSGADNAALTGTLADLEAKTTDQLVVVTLKSLQGTTIEDYGYQLGRRWKIGQKDKDSGVLLIVAAGEQKVRIEVGYGLEGALTDAATRVIIENSILPRFRTGDFPGGIKSGVADIVQMLVGDAGSTQPRSTQSSAAGNQRQDAKIPVWLAIVLGLALVGLLIVCAVTKGGGICQAIMQIFFVMALSGRGGSSRGKSSFSGGGGSFGGGGSSGSW